MLKAELGFREAEYLLGNLPSTPNPKEKNRERGRAAVVVLWTVNNPKVVLWSYVVCENDHRSQIIA